MYNYRSAYNVIYGKALVVKCRPGIALIAKEGRHISGMVRMRGISRIVMTSDFAEIIGTVAIFMNVKGIEVAGAWRNNIRQSKYFCFYQYAAISALIKFYKAAEPGVGSISPDPGRCLRALIGQELCKVDSGGNLISTHDKIL